MTDLLRHGPGCVDDETLAAFIDGRLEPRERATVETHLADCADCYEAFVETARTRDDLRAEGGGTLLPWWRQPRIWYGTIGAIAATVAVLVWMPRSAGSREAQLNRALGPLVTAVGSHRLTEGRLSEPFAWGPVPSASRGTDSSTTSPEVEIESRALREAARALPAAESARASGVALLAVGNIDGAVEALREAAGTGDVATKIDLSAVLLERWRQRRDPADAQEARRFAGEAVAQDASSAEALFNLGLATEALGQKAAALDAWTRYQALDATSAWSAEARARTKTPIR